MSAHGTTGGTTGTGGGGEQGRPQLPQRPVESDSTVGGEIHADPAGMRAGARMFESSAGYATGIESRFLSGTSALHGIRGTDDTGKNVEQGRITGATEALRSIGEGPTALPGAVGSWADGYAKVDEDNAIIADGLARHVQDGA